MSPAEIVGFVNSCYPPARDARGATLFDEQGNAIPTGKTIVPYSYTLTFTLTEVGTTGANASLQLPITANADFLHLRTAYRANVAGAAITQATQVIPLARILITDSGTNEQFMNSAVDLSSYATVQSADVVAEHTFPRIISGRSSLTVSLSSYEAVNTNVIDVVFIGCLIRVLN